METFVADDYFDLEDSYANSDELERSSLIVEFTEIVDKGETPSVKFEAALICGDDIYDFSAGDVEFDSFEAFKVEVYESLLNDILSMDGCDFKSFSASNR